MKSNFQRTTINVLVVIAIFLCAIPYALSQNKPPVKIGFLSPLVGVWSQNGQDMDKGFKLAMDEVGYKAGGRQITVITEDTQGAPEIATNKVRKLITSDKVDVLAGEINAAAGLAIRDMVVNAKVPIVFGVVGAWDLTNKLKSPYIFRPSWANGQQELAGGWYAYNKMGMRRMIVLAPDFVGGHEKADAFIKAFKAAGGQVVEEIYPPINTNDFGPYLTRIQGKAKQVDGLWVFFVGTGAIRFIQQYDEYGLKKTVPIFTLGDTVDDSYLPSLKDAALGIKNYCQYGDMLKTPENEKFVKEYMAKYKLHPSMYSEQGYIAAKVILLGLEAVKGNVENKEAFMAAMRNAKFTAPRGPFLFDASQNAIFPVYLREVEKVDGRYANVILGKIADNVDQNWSPSKMK